MTKPQYYSVDASPFGVRVLLCFDQKGADSVLEDHDIDFSINAFDLGVAETHYISDGREAIILVIVDPAKCDHDPHFAAGIMAHESYHIACRIFQHIGQPLLEVGEEVFAYTIEHLTKQMSLALEEEINARKKRRSPTKQKGKRSGGTVVQVDQLGDGRARPNSAAQQQVLICGTKDDNGSAFSETEARVRAAAITGFSGSGATNV